MLLMLYITADTVTWSPRRGGITSPGCQPREVGTAWIFSPEAGAILVHPSISQLVITPTLGLQERIRFDILSQGYNPGLVMTLRWSWERSWRLYYRVKVTIHIIKFWKVF
jgi:hypothetical protein